MTPIVVSGLRFLADMSALLVSAALFPVAGYLASGANRGESGRLLLAARVIGLILLALFVWLRPNVADLTRLPLLIPAALSLFLVGRALARTPLRRVTPAVTWIAVHVRRPATLVTALVVLAALPLAARVAELWDVSGFMDSHGYDTYGLNIATGKQPAGNSQYMPAYQYGLAAIYYIAGHFFFVPQILNVVLACAGIAALCWAGWLLYGSSLAVLVIGVLAAFSRTFIYAVHTTQIEAWYLPATAAILLAWVFYWRRPATDAAVWLAIALSVGMNLRNQGAIFFAFMGLAPLVVSGIAWRSLVSHTLAIGAIVAASLVPWTIRNYLVDGRLSPSGSRSALYLGVLNDRRIGLYGIRYWDGWNDVLREFETRYPDPAAREAAFVGSMWSNATADPAWLARAIAWRTVAFYGLLPDGYLVIDSIVPPNWADEWRRYVYWRTGPLLLLPLTLVTLAFRANRTTFFLVGAICANLGINIVSATSEDRLCYPVLLIHMLLVGSLFAKARPDPASIQARPSPSWVPSRRLAASVAAVGVALVVCRVLIGSQYLYRPLLERRVTVNPLLQIDTAQPLFDVAAHAGDVTSAPGEVMGERRPIRLRGMLTNYMYPPKWAGALEGIPSLATDPQGPQFYYLSAFVGESVVIGSNAVGITFANAEVSEPLREGDAVELEADVLHFDQASGLWLHARRLRKLPVDRRELPPFS